MRGEADAVVEALRNGCDPDSMPGGERRTALMWAAALGFPDVTRVLALYSRVDQQDPRGKTALHYAVRGLSAEPPLNRSVEHLETVRALMMFGADANIEDTKGLRPMDYAGTASIKKFLGQVRDLRNKGQKNATAYTLGVGAFSRLGHGEDDKDETFPKNLPSLE